MPFSKITGGLIFQDQFNYQNVVYEPGQGNSFANQVGPWQAVYVHGGPYGTYVEGVGPEGGYAWPLGIENTGPPQSPTSISTQSEDEGYGTGECYYEAPINLGTGPGRQVHIYALLAGDGIDSGIGFQTPNTTIFNTYISGAAFSHAYGELSPADEGTVTCKVAHSYANYGSLQVWIANLVICTSNILTLTGFAAGQRVEVYQQASPNPTLIASTTVPTGSTVASIDFSNIFFPYQYFFKVYDTNGKLVETTPLYLLCAGDTWSWTAPIAGLIASTSNFITYQIGGPNPGLPQNATISALLNDQNGNPYSGATIQFSTDLGVLSASSVLTDVNGRASVTLSSTKAGIAVVMVVWGGDPNNLAVPAATGFVQVHVWSSIETPDPTQPFQFFCEGREYAFDDGTYTFAANEVVGNFEVDIPVWQPSITLLGICSIYRFGVKEFSGILTRVERTLSDSPSVKLIGVDASWLLNTRVIDQAQFVGAPQDVLAALLTRYETGIAPGNFNLPTTPIAFVFNTVQLLAAIRQVLATVTGSQFKVNANLTFDASDEFGNYSDAGFVEGALGGNAIASSSSSTLDASLITNNMHVSGGGTPPISSVAADSESIADYGLIEGTDLQPSVTDQATLDLIAAFDAAIDGFAGEQIQLTVIDTYPTGTYGLYDYVNVTSPTLGLSGFYQVMQITRPTLTNPYAAQLQLGARVPELWQMDEPGKRIVSQLGGLVSVVSTIEPPSVDAFASGTGSANMTHAANVMVIIFITNANNGVGSCSVGGVAATSIVENTGGEGYFFAYQITRTAAGTETISVTDPNNNGLDFVAISIKDNEPGNLAIDAAVGGAATQSNTCEVTVPAGFAGRLVLVCTSIFEGGTSITLDNQLTQITTYNAMAAGGISDSVGNSLTFNCSGSTGAGWIASLAVAVKPVV